MTATVGVEGETINVTLRGTSFVPGATAVIVSGTNVTVTDVNVASETSLTADFVIAAGAALGPRNVSVVTAGGSSDTTAFVVNPAVPTLASLTPGIGVQGTTAAVTFAGTNFVAGATTVAVSGAGVTAGNVSVSSRTSLTVDLSVAAGAALGARNVTIATAGGTSAAQTFTVNPPVPTLTSVVPGVGVQGTPIGVTLTGTAFVTGATTVTVSGTGVTASGVNVTSATSLTVDLSVAADAALGARSVTITTAGGTSAGQIFTVVTSSAAQLLLDPAAPTAFTKVAGGTVANAPAARVLDGAGNPVTGVAVTFTTTLGGTTTGQQTLNSDATGTVSMSGVMTPDLSGSYTITATVASVPGANVAITLTVSPAGGSAIAASGVEYQIADASGTTMPIATGPSVTVRDVFGNLVPGWTVDWSATVCASGFTLGGATSQTSGVGVATAPTLTVPANTAGSCRLTASINGGTGIPFYEIVKPAGSSAWLGVTTAYATSTNWSSGAAPTSTTDIFVPRAVPNVATLGGDGVARAVTVETGTSLALGTRTLVASGSIVSNGSITNGTLKLQATSATTIRGALPTTEIGGPAGCVGGTYSLSGATTTGSVTVNCTLTIGANSLTTGGALTVATARGKLVMQTAGGVVDVAGLATFSSATHGGFLTNGTLRLRNGLTVLLLHADADVYAPSGNHVTQFTGTAAQTVNMCIPCSNGSQLRNTDFAASSNVQFDNSTNFTGTFTAHQTATIVASSVVLTVSGDVTTETGSSLAGVSEISLTGGTRFPHFGGASTPALVTLNADLALDQTSAVSNALTLNTTLIIAGQHLTIGGALTVQTITGKLNMTGGGQVTVSGAATFAGGSLSGLLTAGTLELRGNFSQSSGGGSPTSFKATGTHLTILNGSGAQSVSFTSTAASSFNDLSVENTSASGVTTTTIAGAGRDLFVGASGGATTKLTMNQTFNVNRNLDARAGAKLIQSGPGKRILVTGAVTANATADFGGVDSLRLVGSSQPFPIYNNTTAGKAPKVTHVSGSTILNADVTVAGGVSIGSSSSVDLNGKRLTIRDSLINGGTLTMSNAAGVLEVGGNLLENGTTTGFVPTSGFLVRLNGTSAQRVEFLTGSRFSNLDVTNTAGVSFDTRVDVFGTLAVRANARLTVLATKLLGFDNPAVLRLHSGATFTINGSVSTNAWTCQRHDGTPFGAIPALNGTNTSASDGSAFVAARCDAGATSVP